MRLWKKVRSVTVDRDQCRHDPRGNLMCHFEARYDDTVVTDPLTPLWRDGPQPREKTYVLDICTNCGQQVRR